MEQKYTLLEFGEFKLIPAERLLTYQNQPVKIPLKAFELLFFFLRNNNQVIGKETLMRELWGEAYVEDANLTVHISTLRKIFAKEDSVKIETFPKKGYRFVAEVREINNGNETMLKDVSDEGLSRPANQVLIESAAPQITPRPVAYRRQTIILTAVSLFLLIGLAFSVYKYSKPPFPFQSMKLTRLVQTGKVGEAALSPDGKYLAYVTRDPGVQSLSIKNIASNSIVQLAAPAAVSFGPLTFSNDGGFIYYSLRQKDKPDTLYQIPVLGGEPKKILENVSGSVSFAPDGEQFAYVKNISPNETALIIANLKGGEERQLALQKNPELFTNAGPAWSPDGKTIVCSGVTRAGERTSYLVAVSVADGAIRELTNQKWRNIERPVWLSDGSGLLAAAMELGKPESGQVWFFPFPTGNPQPVTNDLNNYGGLSLTADSKKLTTIEFEIRRKIYLQANEMSQPVSLTDDMIDAYRAVSWTPDNKILFTAETKSTRDIWVMDGDGSHRKQLTDTKFHELLPVASPDGRYIVFGSNRTESGAVNLWRINTDGSNPLQITNGPDEAGPNITPDSRWILYVAGGIDSSSDKRSIWKVPIDGGTPMQLTTNPSYGADVSPDGKQFVCWYKTDDKSAPWKAALIPIDGGQPTKLLDIPPGSPLRWTPDGQAVSYIKTENSVGNIWSQPINGGPPRQITNFTAEQILFFDWSKDNRLVFSRGFTSMDAVLIESTK